jgi:hypothetical protein
MSSTYRDTTAAMDWCTGMVVDAIATHLQHIDDKLENQQLTNMTDSCGKQHSDCCALAPSKTCPFLQLQLLLQLRDKHSLLRPDQPQALASILACLKHPQARVCCCGAAAAEPGLPGGQVLRNAEAQRHDAEGFGPQRLQKVAEMAGDALSSAVTDCDRCVCTVDRRDLSSTMLRTSGPSACGKGLHKMHWEMH